MYGKALLFNDKFNAYEILNAEGPTKAKQFGRRVKGFDLNIWKDNCEKIMFECCYEKFKQNKKLQKILLSTNDSILIEASPRDKIWGIGFNAKTALKTSKEEWGSNLLGLTLMKVRAELMKEARMI